MVHSGRRGRGIIVLKITIISISLLLIAGAVTAGGQVDPGQGPAKTINAIIESGTSYNANGQYKEAMAEFNKVIEMDPKNAEAYNYRGYSCILAGDFDRAIADYTKAIDLKPLYADAYYNRGLVYDMQKNDREKAIYDLTKAIQLKPKFGEAYLGLSLIHI